MANLAVFASGNGSNFQAIAARLRDTNHHLVCLICDRQAAFVRERARSLGVPVHTVSYRGRDREAAEREFLEILASLNVEFIALAGFMRLLSPLVVERYPGRIVNIHPSLLPKYPGTNAIEESFNSSDSELGITIHYVDHGMDTGPVICRASFRRNGTESIESIAEKIHALEHSTYPRVVVELLDALEKAPDAAVENTRSRS